MQFEPACDQLGDLQIVFCASSQLESTSGTFAGRFVNLQSMSKINRNIR